VGPTGRLTSAGAPVAPLRRLSRRWRTGWATAAGRRWRGHPPASLGSRAGQHAQPVGSPAACSGPPPASACQDGSAPSALGRGSSPCIVTGSARPRCAPPPPGWPGGPAASAPPSWHIVLRLSSLCHTPSCSCLARAPPPSAPCPASRGRASCARLSPAHAPPSPAPPCALTAVNRRPPSARWPGRAPGARRLCASGRQRSPGALAPRRRSAPARRRAHEPARSSSPGARRRGRSPTRPRWPRPRVAHPTPTVRMPLQGTRAPLCAGFLAVILGRYTGGALRWPRRFAPRAAPLCAHGPRKHPFAPGGGALRSRRAPAARGANVAPGSTGTGLPTPAAWPRRRSAAPTAPLARSPGASKAGLAPPRPWGPPPPRAPGPWSPGANFGCPTPLSGPRHLPNAAARALQSFQKKAAKLGSTLSVASPLTR